MHKKLLEQYKTIKKSTPAPVSRHQNVPVPEVKSLSSRTTGESSRSNVVEKKARKLPPKEMLSYHDLLNLANEKKDIPPEFPVLKVPARTEGEEFDYGRPMTAKEKAAYEAEKALRDRVMKQVENGTFLLKPANEIQQSKTPAKSAKPPTFKIPVKNVPPKPSSSSSSGKVDNKEDSRGYRKQQAESSHLPKPASFEKIEKRKSEDSPRPMGKVKIAAPEQPITKSVLPLNPYMDFVPVVQPRKDPSIRNEASTIRNVPSSNVSPHSSLHNKDHVHMPQKPRPSCSAPPMAQRCVSPPPMKKAKRPSLPHNENEQHRNSISNSKSCKEVEQSRPKPRELNNSDRDRDERKRFEERRNSNVEILQGSNNVSSTSTFPRKNSVMSAHKPAPKNYPPPPLTNHDRRDIRLDSRKPPPQFEERRKSKLPEPSIKKGMSTSGSRSCRQ